MGMAASQARFLNLTARKTNLEYQGQQINQQRTELSNASANLYNQMLSLQVPTPPNTQDYTKVSYTFMMPGGNDEATISQFVKDSSGTYTVAFSYKTVELGMVACSDGEKPKETSKVTGWTDDRYTTSVTYDTYTIATNSGKSYTLYKYQANTSDTDEKKIHEDAVTALGGGTVYWINVGTDSSPKYQYYKESDLTSAGVGGAVTYYTADDIETYKEDTYTKCTVNRDVQNRVQSFTSNGTTFAVTTNTITDEDAYNDAMNEYTYKSYLYEQAMANINAKTSVIQIQDRELELKLKQLDTEHNAIQTETDSVQSVCKKNVEDSFKVFA